MDDGSILNISVITNPNLVHIATDDGIKPDGTVFTHPYITDYRGIGCQPAVFSKFWSDSIYVKNIGHF
jgi:hypothetical protein